MTDQTKPHFKQQYFYTRLVAPGKSVQESKAFLMKGWQTIYDNIEICFYRAKDGMWFAIDTYTGYAIGGGKTRMSAFKDATVESKIVQIHKWRNDDDSAYWKMHLEFMSMCKKKVKESLK